MHIMHAHTEERGFLSGPPGTGLSLLMMLEPESWIYCGGEGRGRTAHYNQIHTLLVIPLIILSIMHIFMHKLAFGEEHDTVPHSQRTRDSCWGTGTHSPCE